MSLAALHEKYRWPEREDILNPSGAGPRFFVDLVRKKLQTPLRRLSNSECRVGVLTGHPGSDETEAPIAIVCEFPRAITEQVLKEAHKLAWNFCRSPLLITVEPHLTRAWSCYETPDRDPEAPFRLRPVESLATGVEDHLVEHAASALDWIHLASGQFFTTHASRFPRTQRADRTLLENLRFVRTELKKSVPEDIAHDLLARLVFIQFLFDRKDSRGTAALNESVFVKLHETATLSKRYRTLGALLGNKTDTYSFFHWLDERFNGDLFPGKVELKPGQEDDWAREERLVNKRHLDLLADFVSGRVAISEGGQMSLWPLYSFDTIPLEFISSIYEEFACNADDGRGDHYTPIHLVDFMLDKVLPWDGEQWDLRILDPACGSGIFLVRAFQRLIYRWRNAHPEQEPPAAMLRQMVESNLFGVDVNDTAVRVASFSLYLAMCDEIDPRHYWTQVRFPRLREVTLRHADFFQEDIPGIRTSDDAGRYDLVIGNAPWGQQSLTESARTWAAHPEHEWETPNEQIGTLFLPKSAALAKPEGRVCLIQPAGSLLFNRSKPAIKFRRKLFTNYKAEEVVNLSALRFDLFPKATGPACIVTLSPKLPDGEPLAYWCPKRHFTGRRGHRIDIDGTDLNWVYPKEAAGDPWSWTALAWGGRRDHELIRRLKGNGREGTLGKTIKREEGWSSTKGFERRIKGVEPFDDRLGKRILEDHAYWSDCDIVCFAKRFPRNENPLFGRPRELEAFRLPKLIMRLSWTVEQGRFKSSICLPDEEDSLLLFSQSYYGISAPTPDALTVPAIVLNSMFAVYFLFLTSASVGSFRPKLLNSDIEEVPIPNVPGPTVSVLSRMSLHEIDERAFALYGLKETERVLIQDFFEITLQDFKGDQSSPGRQPALKCDSTTSEVLWRYCESFLSVLRAAFGPDKAISSTIFVATSDEPLPYCFVAIHLNWPGREPIVRETLEGEALVSRLYALDRALKESDPEEGGVFYQKVARVYDIPVIGGIKIPTVYLVKPNQVRYWMRSAAFRDADDVAADILVWDAPANGEQQQDITHA